MKNKKGFTLIEMIVVIVIVAILAALAVPTVMKYIDEANDTKLIAKARVVLLSAQEEAMDLLLQDKIKTLPNDKTRHQAIIEAAAVGGELCDIKLNAQGNSSGDFIVQFGSKYVIYDDINSTFTVKDEAEYLTIVEKLRNALTDPNSDAIKAIAKYFKEKNNATLDSEGVNFGQPLKQLLANLGFDPTKYSFSISPDGGKYRITITETLITTEMANSGQRVKVTQFDYGDDASFQATPTITEGEASLGTKTIQDTSGKDNTFAYIDLNNIIWK